MVFKADEVVYLQRSEDCQARAVAEHCAGMEILGQGLFARVYGSSDTPYVVKVVRAVDAGYLTYIRLIRELAADHPNVPRVHRVIHYRHTDGYQPWESPGFSDQDFLAVYLERLQQPRRCGNRFIDPNRSDSNRPVDWYVKKLDRIVQNYRAGLLDQFRRLRPQHQDLVVLLALAADKTGSDFLDLHAGNVMSRRGHFVVTDPLTG